MFTWFSVLRRLSREDSFISQQEKRIQRLEAVKSEAVEVLEKLQQCIKEWDDLREKCEKLHGTLLDDLNKTSTQTAAMEQKMQACGKQASEKVAEIYTAAKSYTEKINDELNGFDDKIAEFNKQISQLKQTVTDYLR